MRIQLLTAAEATTLAPALAADGFALDRGSDLRRADAALLLVKSTAGSDAMSVTIRLWGYSEYGAAWFPLGAGADASKGVINLESAMGETGTDSIRHSEIVSGLSVFDRLYAQVTAIGGTATAISAYLVARSL
jgi:hypothetical protein